MRRMIPVLTAVATLAVASSAFAGHTAIELYQYFGDPVIGLPADPAPGAPTNSSPLSNPNIVLTQGESAWFPIYMELRAGNGRPNLNSVGFEVYANGTAGLSNTGNVSVSPFASDSTNFLAAPGSGAAHSLGGVGTMLRGPQFHFRAAAANDPGNTTVFLGWMQVTGNAVGMSDLYFSVSVDATKTYAFQTTSATLNSIAFGADPGDNEDGTAGPGGAAGDQGDGINGYRLQNTAQDVGVAAGLMSTLADAKITVVPVPEPTTIGLLGLGLLAIRRRRA